MTIERTGMSRRRLLTTAAVGVPAMGVLGAVNLLGAPAAKAARLPVDGVWGWGTSRALEYFLSRVVFPGANLNDGGRIRRQPSSWSSVNSGLGSGWEWVPDRLASGSAALAGSRQGWSDRPCHHPGPAGPLRQGHGWRPG